LFNKLKPGRYAQRLGRATKQDIKLLAGIIDLTMEFNPNNNIVSLCVLGMAMEDEGKPGEAGISQRFTLYAQRLSSIHLSITLLITYPRNRVTILTLFLLNSNLNDFLSCPVSILC
jgi:hypothetical protein